MPPVDPVDLGLGSNPVLEEVEEESDGAQGVEDLKAAHRRKRGGKASGGKNKKKKKNADHTSSSLTQVFVVLLIAALIFIVGQMARHTAMDRKSNSCKMTYSRPEYVPLPVTGFTVEGDAFPGNGTMGNVGYGYRLLRYIDRKLPASDRKHPMRPGGFPVLFVPGHRGNYQQVRSLGSLAAELKISEPGERLDIFTLDFLGEWSVLHASMTWRQAEFVNHAVEAILNLYGGGEKSPFSARCVMIVGHSYGGLVARAAFTLPSYRPGSIGDIVTLGTPHDRAPWMMDYSIRSLYRCTDWLWRWHSPSPSMSIFSPCWTPKSTPTADATARVTQEIQSTVVDQAMSVLSSTGADSISQEACAAGGSQDCAIPAANSEEPVSSESIIIESETIESESVRAGSTKIAKPNVAVGWSGAKTDGVDAGALLGDIVLLGVAGGPEDLMVHPSLCVTEGLGLEGQSVSYTTQALEGCGFGVDHAALVWCKQLASRVVETLSELGKLKTAGVGARERTREGSRALASSSRLTQRLAHTVLGRVFERADDRWAKSVGFDAATEAGSSWVIVCRSVVTNRAELLIPAWVLIGGLVLAALFARGLAAKIAKDGQLSRPVLLLSPAQHLPLQTFKTTAWSYWTYVRAEGLGAVALLLILFDRLSDRIFGYSVSTLLLYAFSRCFPSASAKVSSTAGNSAIGVIVVKAWRSLDGAVVAAIRLFNPFTGAADALRLPPAKGLMVIYVFTLGWMVVFAFLVATLGSAGSRLRRAAKRSPAPVSSIMRALESRQAATLLACAVVFAAHVQKFSLPPTFRTPTLQGEMSVVFLALSLSLYALLGSMAVFPSASSIGATFHQRLLVLLYAPVPALLIGPQLAAAGLLYRNAGPKYPSFIAPGELMLMSLAILPMLLSAWNARQGKQFPAAPSIRGFVAEWQALMQEELSRNNGGSVPRGNGYTHGAAGAGGSDTAADLAREALEMPHGHSACGKCLHADGGKGAVFVETCEGMVSVGGGVTVGPGFRVTACDCPRREPAAPSTWCEFCRCVCDTCGGCKEAVRAVRRSNMEGRPGAGRGCVNGAESGQIGPAGVVGVVSVGVMYVGLWCGGMTMLAEPCHCLWALAVVGMILCGMQRGMVSGK